MANSGIEVTNVEVEFLGDGMSLGFTPSEMNAENFDVVSQRCTDELVQLWSQNSTTTRPE